MWSLYVHLLEVLNVTISSIFSKLLRQVHFLKCAAIVDAFVTLVIVLNDFSTSGSNISLKDNLFKTIDMLWNRWIYIVYTYPKISDISCAVNDRNFDRICAFRNNCLFRQAHIEQSLDNIEDFIFGSTVTQVCQT